MKELDLLGSAIENSPLAFTLNKVVYNPQGIPIDFTLIKTNPAFEKKIGCLTKECLGKSITEWLLTTPALKEQWLPVFCNIVTSKTKYETDELLEFSDHYYIVTAFVPKQDYLIILFNELAIPKLDKNSTLKEAEVFCVRNSKLFQQSPFAIAFYEVINDGLTSNDYIIKAINPKCKKAEGWTEANVLGKSIKEAKPDVDSFGLIPVFQQAWRTGDSIDCTIRITKEGRRDRWVENTVFKVSPFEIVAFYNDVTDKMLAEQALFSEKERLKVTLYSIGEGVIVADKQGCVEMLNQVAEKLTGWNNEQAQGQELDKVFEVYDEKTGERYCELVKHILETGAFEKDCILIKSENGNKKITSIIATPIKDASGQVLGIVMVFKDITEEREKQAKIEYLSYKDSLTGLYNRHYFKQVFDTINSKEYLPLTIIMGDLVGLKLINDAFGHQYGDKAIIMIADTLKQCCQREKDIIFRWGGDEFLILLANTPTEEGRKIRDKIIHECSKLKLRNINLNVSFGRATKLSSSEVFEDLLIVAEDKMYKNKLLTSKFYRNNVLNSIKQLLFEKSHDIKDQMQNIVELCKKVGVRLNLPIDQLNDLEILASLHDIGEIAIDNSILEKPDKLTKQEWREIKKHPETGYRIASSILELKDIAEYILSHHERWDGKGYPRELKGEQIPLLARILSVVDAYDAMTNNRPYRKAMTKEAAQAELISNAGTHFDPHIVDVFLQVLDI